MIKGMAMRSDDRRRFFLIPSGLVLFCALLLTCNIDLSVNATYLDASRNWISDFGLGVARTAESSGWAFDYAGQTGDDYPYMAIEDTGPVSGTLPEGLDAASAAFRLSIANLMPDPDFTSGTVAPRWGVGHVGISVGNPLAPTIVGSGIHGNSLRYNRGVDQYISLLLSDELLNAAGAGIGPVDGSMYQINLLFYGSNNPMNYSPDLNDKLQAAVVPNSIYDVRIQSQTFAQSTQNYSLFFGPNGNQTPAFVDDIRVVRKVIPLYLSLDMRLSDVNPTFISGRYVFSVWVKNDPAATFLHSGSATAPYQSRALTLEIRALSRTDGGSMEVFRPEDSVAGWSEWTRVDLEFPAGEKLAIDQTDADPVFSLKISPADLSSANGLDAAQILIAQPSLTFHYE